MLYPVHICVHTHVMGVIPRCLLLTIWSYLTVRPESALGNLDVESWGCLLALSERDTGVSLGSLELTLWESPVCPSQMVPQSHPRGTSQSAIHLEPRRTVPESTLC